MVSSVHAQTLAFQQRRKTEPQAHVISFINVIAGVLDITMARNWLQVCTLNEPKLDLLRQDLTLICIPRTSRNGFGLHLNGGLAFRVALLRYWGSRYQTCISSEIPSRRMDGKMRSLLGDVISGCLDFDVFATTLSQLSRLPDYVSNLGVVATYESTFRGNEPVNAHG